MWNVIAPTLQPLLVAFGVAALVQLVLGAVRGFWMRRIRDRNWPVRVLVVVVHAVLLLFIMVAWVNGVPGFFEENTRMVHVVAGLDELRHGPPDPREQGVDLILVDQVKSKVVVAPSGDGYAESGVPITDRRQLTAVFELLAAHRAEIGLVVCDILFEGATPQDSALAAAMLPLVEDRKLVLARGNAANTNHLNFSDAMASVLAGTQSGKVVRQELVTSEGLPTLPYLMHARYHELGLRPSRWGYFQVEESADGPHRAYPYFIPFMDRLSETSYQLPVQPVGASSIPLPTLRPLELRHLAKAGEMLLLPRIQASPAPRGPVIFIGEFLGSPELGSTDQHLTYRGEMQGSTILLNQFLELEAGSHLFRWEPLIIQLVILALISWLLFCHYGRPEWMDGSLLGWYYKEPAKVSGPTDLFHAALTATTKYIKAALPSLLIGLFFGAVGWCFRQPANIGALVIYLVLLDRFARHANKTTHEASEPPPAAPAAAVPPAEHA